MQYLFPEFRRNFSLPEFNLASDMPNQKLSLQTGISDFNSAVAKKFVFPRELYVSRILNKRDITKILRAIFTICRAGIIMQEQQDFCQRTPHPESTPIL